MSIESEIELKYLSDIPNDPEAIIELLKQCVDELKLSKAEFTEFYDNTTEYQTVLEQEKANIEEDLSVHKSSLEEICVKYTKMEQLLIEQKKEIKGLNVELRKKVEQIDQINNSGTIIASLQSEIE